MLIYTSSLLRKYLVNILAIGILIGSIITGSIIYRKNFISGYLYMFDIDVINSYGTKPYIRIEGFCAGILMALVYDKISWYLNETTKYERKQ